MLTKYHYMTLLGSIKKNRNYYLCIKINYKESAEHHSCFDRLKQAKEIN